ncbi:MAG: FHA domain-containing protein [Proteobacteria bacterium]|nr:FHA domain-containing protein [Pseudomonadota bacterium]NDC23803.1 FHA domain-containing protein [Pseudomonadota bacterium]NDD05592.1 FHA domain-containing protein [Pseudomonadota bacterium]NDG27277.1 FHA domain-containing protein [Pseudomonadota bacterium]
MKLIIDIYQSGQFIQRWEQDSKEFYTIGRLEGDLIISDSECSRTHALFFSDETGQLCILDLGSTNGTFVADQPIEYARLSVEDKIRLGQTELYIMAFHSSNGITNPSSAGQPSSDSLILKGWPQAMRALPKDKLDSFIDFFNSSEIKLSVRLQEVAAQKKKIE